MRASILVKVLLPALVLALSACGGQSTAEKPKSAAGPEMISEAERHFNAGVEFEKQGLLEAAISEYDEAIRLNSQDAEAYNGRGVVYGRLGPTSESYQGPG